MTLSMPHQFVYCSVVAVFDTFDLFCVHICVCVIHWLHWFALFDLVSAFVISFMMIYEVDM